MTENITFLQITYAGGDNQYRFVVSILAKGFNISVK